MAVPTRRVAPLLEQVGRGSRWGNTQFMFLGEFTHTLDPKGRLTIPARFRAQLADGLVISRGQDTCLVIYPVREWEALRVEVKDGVVTYLAQPGGRPATPFPAATITDTSVTFSNPSHDFPQRILYRKVGADSLVARIEGDQGGQVRGMNFPMKRVACVGG